MPAFFIYLRNITYYLMFVAVIGMLAPPGKYKKFVSLVMGFILLSTMAAPLARFGSELPVTDWFGGPVSNEAQNESRETAYTNWRNTYLRGAFEEQIIAQLENLLTQSGFIVYEVSVTFPDDFTRLDEVRITVSRDEPPRRVPFIRIQPVQVGEPEHAEACPASTAAKNIISQFYNLPTEHINVTVR
ncbi:MAG: stage III sporulation protein AF [Firmicutes bacterium]|nr:stage III sporulation protein AF [Bacillota bacterium]